MAWVSGRLQDRIMHYRAQVDGVLNHRPTAGCRVRQPMFEEGRAEYLALRKR
jgi:hypothetical protein